MFRNSKSNVEYFERGDNRLYGLTFEAAVGQILDNINQKIAAEKSLDDVMSFVFEETREIYPCDRMCLAFVEDEGQRVIAHWVKTRYETVLLKTGYSEDLSQNSLNKVIIPEHRRVIHDLEAYLAENPNSTSSKLLVEEGIRSSMTCPLKVEDRIVGLFFRSSRRAYSYTPLQIKMHMATAERISQAIEKAFRIEQLTKAVQEYREMLGFVSHELKSPISSIVMDCHVLLGKYIGDLNPAQRRKVQQIIRKGNHLLGLVRDYLDLARLESGELKLVVAEEVDLMQEVIKPAIDLVQPEIERRVMDLKISASSSKILATCDPRQLTIVMVNLLSNAVKYGYPVGDIDISIVKNPSQLIISVRNEGPGFPEAEKQKLFRKFSRLTVGDLKKQKGTGLGLYTVWRIARLHGGMASAESKEKQWAQFTIQIPQPPVSNNTD